MKTELDVLHSDRDRLVVTQGLLKGGQQPTDPLWQVERGCEVQAVVPSGSPSDLSPLDPPTGSCQVYTRV